MYTFIELIVKTLQGHEAAWLFLWFSVIWLGGIVVIIMKDYYDVKKLALYFPNYNFSRNIISTALTIMSFELVALGLLDGINLFLLSSTNKLLFASFILELFMAFYLININISYLKDKKILKPHCFDYGEGDKKFEDLPYYRKAKLSQQPTSFFGGLRKTYRPNHPT